MPTDLIIGCHFDIPTHIEMLHLALEVDLGAGGMGRVVLGGSNFERHVRERAKDFFEFWMLEHSGVRRLAV